MKRICQVRKYRDIYSVLGKALSVLGHPELCEPVRNLLHRGSAQIIGLHPPASANYLEAQHSAA